MMGDTSDAETTDSRLEATETPGGGGAGGEESGDGGVSRRSFMRAGGATAAAGAMGVAATGGASAQSQTYQFGGEVQGWQGRSPSDIDGEENPTIQLQAGTEYTFQFENLDGAPHNMTIRNGSGSVIVQSDLVSSQGGTASVTFTATPNMAEYICTIHPTTMVGTLEVSGEAQGGGGGISPQTVGLVTAIVFAFLSPILFALFLFSRHREGGETAPRT